ncbi:hypothetical protein HOD75_02685 [archaeon]|jgi:hypothetical protein|nr:hypothetical protein [archaeon]MBT4241781.1 hypothetical protein [archaeon]MBT4418329.1 hypothetical protein [archaeon]
MNLPVKEDYDEFLEEFSKGVRKNFPSVCFYTYGSVETERCDYGRSDIDGGLILSDGVVSDKDCLLGLSLLLADSVPKNLVSKVHLKVLDRASNHDGRFVSFCQDFREHFDKAYIRVGLNHLQEISLLDYKAGILDEAATHLSKIRGQLLYFTLDCENLGGSKLGRKIMLEKRVGVLERVSKLPMKLVYLQTDEKGVIEDRVKSKNRLGSILEDFDFGKLDKINRLLRNPRKLYGVLENDEEALGILECSVDCFEKMIQAYIDKFPEFNKKEIKLG